MSNMSGAYEIVNPALNLFAGNARGTRCTKIIFESPSQTQKWVFENTEGILYTIRNIETGHWASATKDEQVVGCPNFDILTCTWVVNFNGSKTTVNVPAQNSYWTVIGDESDIASVYLRPLNGRDRSAQEFEMRRTW